MYDKNVEKTFKGFVYDWLLVKKFNFENKLIVSFSKS